MKHDLACVFRASDRTGDVTTLGTLEDGLTGIDIGLWVNKSFRVVALLNNSSSLLSAN